MIQCNVLGRSESRTQQKLEKAKELVRKLKTRVHELEKELEEKENSLIRDLRSSKKFKADQTKSSNIRANSGFHSPSSGYGNEGIKLDEVMEDPWSGKSHSDHLKPEGTNDLNAEVNLGKKDVIDLDADDSVFRNGHKSEFSTKLFRTSINPLDSQSKSGLGQNDNRPSTEFECNTSVAKETSFIKHTDAIGKSTFQENLTAILHIQKFQENPILRPTKVTASTLGEEEILTIGGISKQVSRLSSGTGSQQIHNFNPLSDDDFQTPKFLGSDGTRKSISKWCKGSMTAGSATTNTNRGNLIAVGHDGRGGKVKILRDLGRFQDSNSPAL